MAGASPVQWEVLKLEAKGVCPNVFGSENLRPVRSERLMGIASWWNCAGLLHAARSCGGFATLRKEHREKVWFREELSPLPLPYHCFVAA